MPTKEDVARAVREGRIISIIRGFAPEVCLKLAECHRSGGIRLMEVTFNQREPATWADTATAIRALRARFAGEIHVGAGTVLTSEQLRMAIDAGAEYIVTPSLNPALVKAADTAGLATMPGAFTPTEIVQAHEAGATFVKVFPAGNMGPSYLKALLTPLAHIPMLAVGGITPDNVAGFIQAGCVGAGVSGVLANREWIAAGAWDRITDVARRLVRAAMEA